MLRPQRKSESVSDVGIRKADVLAERLGRDSAPRAVQNPEVADQERLAAKQALAADLEGMIEGMLRSTRFATVAPDRTSGWTRQIGELAALDASTDASAFTASSLVADLAQTKPAQAPRARASAPRRWWVDAVLILACLLSVASAGYFTFAP